MTGYRSPRGGYQLDLERNEYGKAFPYSNAVVEAPTRRAMVIASLEGMDIHSCLSEGPVAI